MKKAIKLLSLFLVVCMVFSVSGCKKDKKEKKKTEPGKNVVQVEENVMLTEKLDRVFDAGTYTELDYDFAQKYFADTYDEWTKDGGCTAAAKLTDDGTMLVGRNMDLTITNKAAYYFRTKVEGCYETVNLAYTFRSVSPEYEDVLKNGITPQFRKVLPFLADDVLNSEGLYIEVNMRNGETWPTGETKFGCSGTNPKSNERIYLFSLSRYIGEHCATVDEALEYVKKLDIYSMFGNEVDANNYCFMIADATGHYGLMEFAQNKMFWKDGQQAQANFYVNEELAKIQELKAGKGRYETVMAGIDAVQNEDQMFDLINSVTYYQTYFPEKCKFDNRSEFVALLPYWTYDYVMKDEYRETIENVVTLVGNYLDSCTRQQLRDDAVYWESVFTEVVNCNEKTLFVRFYENDELTLKLSFDD